MLKTRAKTLYLIIIILESLVWFINGLFCKVLNWVPRHQQIVARILGDETAFAITKLIGISEIAMSLWVISRLYSKLCAITQIVLIATMNMIEFILAPDLLLFGKFNGVLALILIFVIWLNEFVVKQNKSKLSIV
jgi:hypothetical protein